MERGEFAGVQNTIQVRSLVPPLQICWMSQTCRHTPEGTTPNGISINLKENVAHQQCDQTGAWGPCEAVAVELRVQHNHHPPPCSAPESGMKAVRDAYA